MCPINNKCSKGGDKPNGRCWAHRGKQYANVVAPVVETPVEVAAPVVEVVVESIIKKIETEFDTTNIVQVVSFSEIDMSPRSNQSVAIEKTIVAVAVGDASIEQGTLYDGVQIDSDQKLNNVISFEERQALASKFYEDQKKTSEPFKPKREKTAELKAIVKDISICKQCKQEPMADDKYCHTCIDKEAARFAKYESKRIAKQIGINDPNQINQMQDQIKQSTIEKQMRDKLSMELLKSAFDDTTIIEYFLKINHKYKSYDNVLYYFNGSYWIKGSDQYIISDIDKIYRELYELVQQHYKDEELIKFLKKIICLRSVKYKETLIKGIIGYVRIEDDLWDLNDDLIGFRNGVYDLRINSFRAGTYEDYISMVIDYDYAKSSVGHLESVEDYFTKIMPIKEERELLLLLLSTCLSGRHLEKFIVCTGVGRNGKDTTFTYLMKKVLGPYYYSCNPTAFTQKIKSDQNVSIANFDKKRIVITSEPDRDETIKTAMVKSLTGSDETAMRTLYSQKTKVNLNETLFMLCNDKPALDHSEQAMLERLIVIPFRCTFKTAQFMRENELTEGENYVYTANEFIKSDNYLDQMKLPTFNYLLPYYRRFRKDGYLIQSIPDSIKRLNESYMEESDEFMNWFNSEYERTTSKDDILKLIDVFRNYSCSDFYENLTKREKRSNNKARFIEKVAGNVSLKIFYKDKHQPYANGKQLCFRNILTNYRIRQDVHGEVSD